MCNRAVITRPINQWGIILRDFDSFDAADDDGIEAVGDALLLGDYGLIDRHDNKVGAVGAFLLSIKWDARGFRQDLAGAVAVLFGP